ncbi:hypothetical protein HPP92_023659 [Vanilla planifolia]|uniref:Uncharacterized protein n=1 Tax=Vanilla planifolia TaxID=51239 RepID=A0A835PYY4_VANPL|nr:hypothetical protein HPP92_023659 [Vanilla planifolia]
MRNEAFLVYSTCHFLVFFLISAQHFPTSYDSSVVSHGSILLLAPGLPLEDSPGSRLGAVLTCNRVHARGLSRLRDFEKFFHSLKLTASISQGDVPFRLQSLEFCLHRNASLGMCMCPIGHWRKLSKGYFVRSLSPFVDWYIDIRMPPDPSRFIEIRTELEFLTHRAILLILGFCMMILAHPLSESIAFYYGGAMTIGIVLVILMVLYQGMKLLPTGRKSSVAIVMYSSIVGIASSLVHHISSLFCAALVKMGIYEDMHKPLGILVLVCLILAGAWCGYWGVRKLVLADDGQVDTDVAYFVDWAILILSGIMILQSSVDTILAAVAVVGAIIASSLSRHVKLKSMKRLLRISFYSVYVFLSTLQFPRCSTSENEFQECSPPLASRRSPGTLMVKVISIRLFIVHPKGRDSPRKSGRSLPEMKLGRH